MSLVRFVEPPIPQEVVDEMVSKLLHSILSLCSPTRVYLFGSAARGALSRESDLDIALVFSDKSAAIAARKKILTRPPLIDWPVDYLFFSESEFEEKLERGGVCELIVREGRQLTYS